MHSESPIFEENGKWYFWDESWSQPIGPFFSAIDVKYAFKKYCDFISYSDRQDEIYWERRRSGKEE